MENQFDAIIFKKKTFGDLLAEIHRNSNKRASYIEDMILDLRTLINSPADALEMVPQIVKFLDTANSNDANLVKLVAIVQRALARDESGGGESFGLTDEEWATVHELAEANPNVLFKKKSNMQLLPPNEPEAKSE